MSRPSSTQPQPRRRRASVPRKGWVYVLTNPAMPGLVKVGRTSRSPRERKVELGAATGVPLPFAVACAVAADDARAAEREVHRILGDRRVSTRREFFRATPQEAEKAAKAAAAAVGGRFVPARGLRDRRSRRGRRPAFLSSVAAAMAAAPWIDAAFGPLACAVWTAAAAGAAVSGKPVSLADVLTLPGRTGAAGFAAALASFAAGAVTAGWAAADWASKMPALM